MGIVEKSEQWMDEGALDALFKEFYSHASQFRVPLEVSATGTFTLEQIRFCFRSLFAPYLVARGLSDVTVEEAIADFREHFMTTDDGFVEILCDNAMNMNLSDDEIGKNIIREMDNNAWKRPSSDD